MYVNGNLDIAGVVSDLKLERLASDPVSPALSRVWFNGTDKKIKYFDGTNVIALAAGGSLDNYLALTGGTLTGALVLAADGVAALEAVTVQQLTAGLTTAGGDVTALAAKVTGGVFVYTEIVTPAASHTVTHNLGNKYGTVVVTDENDEVVIPQSITFNTNNSLTVTFASASLCRVIVSGIKA